MSASALATRLNLFKAANVEDYDRLDTFLTVLTVVAVAAVLIGYTTFTLVLEVGKNEFVTEDRDAAGFQRVMDTNFGYYTNNWVNVSITASGNTQSGVATVRYKKQVDHAQAGKNAASVQQRIITTNQLRSDVDVPFTQTSGATVPILYSASEYLTPTWNGPLGTVLFIDAPTTAPLDTSSIDIKVIAHQSQAAPRFKVKVNATTLLLGQLWITKQPSGAGGMDTGVLKDLRWFSVREIEPQPLAALPAMPQKTVVYLQLERFVMYSELGSDLTRMLGTLMAFWGGAASVVLFAIKALRVVLRCNVDTRRKEAVGVAGEDLPV